jgi:hypothetical protein
MYELHDTEFKQAHPKLRFTSLIEHQHNLPNDSESVQLMCEIASMHDAEQEI